MLNTMNTHDLNKWKSLINLCPLTSMSTTIVNNHNNNNIDMNNTHINLQIQHTYTASPTCCNC